MADMIIQIPEKWQPFVRSLVQSGRFASAEAVIDQGLRLLEERELHTAADNASHHYIGILDRLIRPLDADLSPETAQYFLGLRLAAQDEQRWDELNIKFRNHTLTPAEQAELEVYRRVNYFLGVLWCKARLSLKQAGLPEIGSV